ncbi:HK97 family phage prohead protease [Paroceanicella profunda]|uniref:HK97 family phage prohead protease n=1 Tax=Paroceanicella profunda TaxID=2579971 RepID=A0A5B8FHK5_9RHOB|nr:HK97 family phage prohead protease [Paroceanicella profunda]QDL92541.1 HK97 family phage prohead protease [Paroceanicella profunda]
MEHKFRALDDVEVKDRTITGYASVFDQVDTYGDTILAGAYAKSIRARKALPMLWNHNPDVLIGRWTSLAEDGKGLRVTGELTPGHTEAENAYASLKAGHVDGMSIGYRVPSGGFKETAEGGRLLKQIDLFEVSVVVFPADGNAMIDAVKAVDLQMREFRDVMRSAMRDAGYVLTRKEAEAFMADGYKGLEAMRDAGGRHELEELKAAFLDALHSVKG